VKYDIIDTVSRKNADERRSKRKEAAPIETVSPGCP
jgi:hypothetical protein